eukprot:gb/GECG01012137.1/.p1 GENE.gb/GECG01012137.1/~~gb/GECG01012137.1/.p1  ORF type:complete len:320 (+),score=53.98 gb/GECG01012137.1/:1-960(+)
MNFVRATKNTDHRESGTKEPKQSGFTEQDQVRIAEEASQAYHSRKHGRQGLGASQDMRTKKPKSDATQTGNDAPPVISSSGQSAREKREKLRAFARQQLEHVSPTTQAKEDTQATSFWESIDKAIGRNRPLDSSEIDQRHSDAIFGSSSGGSKTAAKRLGKSGKDIHQSGEHSDDSFDFDAVYASSTLQSDHEAVEDNSAPLYKILQKGDIVLARWPRDGNFYEAVVDSVTHGGYQNARYGVWFTEYQHHQGELTHEDIQFISRPSQKIDEVLTTSEDVSKRSKTESSTDQSEGTSTENENPQKSNWRYRLQQKRQGAH